MIKNILYFGNKLAGHGINPTTIDLLGVILQQEFNVVSCSDKLNKCYRLFDMIKTFFIHRKKVDIILIDTYSTSNFWYALIIAKLAQLFKISYIPILHGGGLPKRLKKNRRLCKDLFGHSVVNVSPSAYLHKIFRDYGYSNICIIHNPIDERLYVPLRRTEPCCPKLLWVRCFLQQYNPQMAIKVLSLIKKKYPQASLCMVGGFVDGSFSECKQLVQNLGVEQSVTFTGKLNKKDWIDKSKECNVFINTTTVDNAPLSVVEAMALGLPVISTNVGGMPYLINNHFNGILVDNNNVEQMADAILNIMGNKDLYDSLSRKSIESGSRYFSSNVLSAWKDLFDKISHNE